MAEGIAGEYRKRTQTEPVKIAFSRQGKGAGATLIEKFPSHPAGKEELLSAFKKRLGVGGSVKNGTIMLQGDHRNFIAAELEASGYRLKVLR